MVALDSSNRGIGHGAENAEKKVGRIYRQDVSDNTRGILNT